MYAIALPALTRTRFPWLALALFAFFTQVLTACATSPLAIAQTPEQKYAAIKVTYDAVLAGAQTFVADTTAPADLRRAVQAAAVESGTIYVSANQAYQEFVAAKAQLAAAPDTPGARLDVATQNLERWLGQLDSAAADLKRLSSRH